MKKLTLIAASAALALGASACGGSATQSWTSCAVGTAKSNNLAGLNGLSEKHQLGQVLVTVIGDSDLSQAIRDKCGAPPKQYSVFFQPLPGS